VGVMAIPELGCPRIIQELLENAVLRQVRHVMPFVLAWVFTNFTGFLMLRACSISYVSIISSYRGKRCLQLRVCCTS
jgi:hypothetical protein